MHLQLPYETSSLTFYVIPITLHHRGYLVYFSIGSVCISLPAVLPCIRPTDVAQVVDMVFPCVPPQFFPSLLLLWSIHIHLPHPKLHVRAKILRCRTTSQLVVYVKFRVVFFFSNCRIRGAKISLPYTSKYEYIFHSHFVVCDKFFPAANPSVRMRHCTLSPCPPLSAQRCHPLYFQSTSISSVLAV